MSLLDDNDAPPLSLDEQLDDLIDHWLDDDVAFADMIDAFAAKLDELRLEEADHERTAEPGRKTEGQ